MIKVGDKVVWESSYKEKCGVVIADIPAGVSAKKHVPSSAKKSHLKIDKDKSSIDRMLVAVRAGKDGQITHYYCPRKSFLVVQGNQED
jgi:hypothetical protein